VTGLLVAVLVVAFGLLVALVVHSARRGVLSSGALVALALVCATALLAMVLTDWLSPSLRGFWDEHGVVSATLSTLLLAGAGFLAFEARENLEQTRATESLATAAFGGLVDHMLDVDLALAMLRRSDRPASMQTDGRPLRWLREQRDDLVSSCRRDPRLTTDSGWEPSSPGRWREALLDQAIRRVMAAMRDWAPLLTQTRDGIGVLVRLGHLRNHLLVAQQAVQTQHWVQAYDEVQFVRAECQVLALGLELGSGTGLDHLRLGVLKTPSLDLEDHAGQEMAQLRSYATQDRRYRRMGARVATGAATHARKCRLAQPSPTREAEPQDR